MSIIDTGYSDAQYSPLEPYGPLHPGDEELMIGAANGSDVTVSEVVVTAPSSGGGSSYSVDYNDYQAAGGSGGSSAFETWAQAIEVQAQAFADAHVAGDPNTPAYQQAHNAVQVLYALVASSPAFANTPMNMPNHNTITFNELLSGLQNITIHIGPISTSHNSYTQWNPSGTAADIYIDPNKLSSYQNAFGATVGVDYVVYHELAHGMPDGFTDRNLGNAEAIANSYGQGLAMLSGAAYPNATQLQDVGGTSP